MSWVGGVEKSGGYHNQVNAFPWGLDEKVAGLR